MNRFWKSNLFAAALIPALWAGSASAGMVTLSFEEVEFSVGPWNATLWDGSDPPGDYNDIQQTPPHTSHGRVVSDVMVNNQVQNLGLSVYGVEISALNLGGGPHLAVIFDSRREGTRDRDLEDPFGPAHNDSNNPHISNGPDRPGHVLIVQENEYPANDCDGGICFHPDDEAGGPNTISFDFSQHAEGVELWEIDIFDIDDNHKDPYWAPENVMLTATFTTGGSEMIQISGNDIGNGKSATLDLSNLFMKNSNVGRLDVKFSSSGALDNLKFNTPMNGGGVPEPTSLALLLTGVVGLGVAHRRRERRKLQ